MPNSERIFQLKDPRISQLLSMYEKEMQTLKARLNFVRFYWFSRLFCHCFTLLSSLALIFVFFLTFES